MPPRISILVPCYNSARFVDACLDGLSRQSYPPSLTEVIFIDNNSTDETAAMVARHSRVTLLREEAQGAYSARNTGLRRATGDIIALTDPDCVPATGWLEEIAAGMADPGVQVALGSYQPAVPRAGVAYLAAYENEKNRFIFNGADPSLYYGYTNNMAARRSLFETLGPFLPIPRGADLVFTRRVVSHFGHRSVVYLPNMAVRHLEVDTVLAYCDKAQVHAASISGLGLSDGFRPLSLAERFQVYRNTVVTNRYTFWQAGVLLGILGLGLGYWTVGGLRTSDPADRHRPPVSSDPSVRRR